MNYCAKLCITVFVLFFLSACSLMSTPGKHVSKFFKTEKAAIVVDKGIAKYDMKYSMVKNMHNAVRVEAMFENPIDATRPIVVEKLIPPGTKEFRIQSPELAGIINHHKYLVVLNLYSVKKGGPRVSKHAQYVKFSHSTPLLKRAGVNLIAPPITSR